MKYLKQINASEIGLWTLTTIALLAAWLMKEFNIFGSNYIWYFEGKIRLQALVVGLSLPAVVSLHLLARRTGCLVGFVVGFAGWFLANLLTVQIMKRFHRELISRYYRIDPNSPFGLSEEQMSASVLKHWIQLGYASFIMTAAFLGLLAVLRNQHKQRLQKMAAASKQVAGIVIFVAAIGHSSSFAANKPRQAKTLDNRGKTNEAVLARSRHRIQVARLTESWANRLYIINLTLT